MNQEAFWLAVGSIVAALTLLWMMISAHRERVHQAHRDQANAFYNNFYSWQKEVDGKLQGLQTVTAVIVERVENLKSPQKKIRKA